MPLKKEKEEFSHATSFQYYIAKLGEHSFSTDVVDVKNDIFFQMLSKLFN